MNFITKEMAQLNVCKLGSKTGRVCIMCRLTKQRWTINRMEIHAYKQRWHSAKEPVKEW